MSAHIVLDQNYATFTNLDIVSGKVYVRTVKSLSASAVTIKLEGESSTRLLPPPSPQNERPKPAIEFHKILYKALTLFPPPELGNRLDGRASFTLPPGTHEYPFSFKIPFNATCALDKNTPPAISVAGMSVEIARPPPGHLRRPLPPTLRGFPGEAEIRYFLKATVARPNILKENVRAYLPFNFSPIEEPRPPHDGAEAYARQKHQFNQALNQDVKQGGKGKRNLFSLRTTAETDEKSQPSAHVAAPLVTVEIRLPEPKILTSNEDIPLKILCTASEGGLSNLFMSSLQIEVAYYTHVRAHQIHRRNQASTLLTSKSNLNIPLEFNDKCEALVPPEMWYGLPVPNVLPPTFEICNLSRDYELIVRIGLRYGLEKRNPQYAHVDLCLPFALYSGIAPPPEVLGAYKRNLMPAPGPAPPPAQPFVPDQKVPPPLPARRPTTKVETTPFAAPAGAALHTGGPSSPLTANGTGMPPGAWPAATGPSSGPPRYSSAGPAQGQASHHQVDGEVYSDAPPSYEAAVADALPPVQVGERRGGYLPPPLAPGQVQDELLGRDEKR